MIQWNSNYQSHKASDFNCQPIYLGKSTLPLISINIGFKKLVLTLQLNTCNFSIVRQSHPTKFICYSSYDSSTFVTMTAEKYK